MELQKAFSTLKNGFTGNPLNNNEIEIKEFKNGYAVSLTNLTANNQTELINYYRDLKTFIDDYKTKKPYINLYVGYWYDTETKLSYLDLTTWCLRKDTALSYADTYGQKAIFDFKNMTSINV